MSAWLRFFRVGLLPTALSNVLLGAFLNGWSYDPDDPIRSDRLDLALLLGVATLLYLFGMGLNDFRDRVRDRTGHPERPLPSGKISPTVALRVLIAVAATAVTLASLLGTMALVWCGVIAGFILLYNLLCKDHQVFGPATMGCVRASLVIFGGVGWPGAMNLIQSPVKVAAAIVGLYVCALTYYSMEEEKARLEVLRRRGQFVLGPLLLLVILAAPELDWRGWLGIGVSLIWTLRVALRPLRDPSPAAPLVTLRLLIGLLFLDLAILVSYHLVFPALMSAALAGLVIGLIGVSTATGFFAKISPGKSAEQSGTDAD